MSRNRKEFGVKVRRARLKHAASKCEGCGNPLVQGRYQFDHNKTDAEGGDNSLENCRVLCSGGKTSCHAIKTKADQKRIAAADATKHRYQGTSKLPTRKI